MCVTTNHSLLWSPTWPPGQTFFVSYSSFSYQREPSTTLHSTPSNDYQEIVMTWYGTYLLNSTCYVCAQSFQLCPTLCNRIECRLPDASVLGILQASIVEWVAMPSSRGSGIKSTSPASPEWQVDSLPLSYRVRRLPNWLWSNKDTSRVSRYFLV